MALELRELLFIPGYREMSSGVAVPLPVDADDFLQLWDIWRSNLPEHAPPPAPTIQTREDAHQALDAVLRRLEDLFGPASSADGAPIDANTPPPAASDGLPADPRHSTSLSTRWLRS